MPPLRGLGLRRCLALLVTFQLVGALKLEPPSNIHLGEPIQISWSVAEGDPESMNLFVSCDSGVTYRQLGPTVPTAPPFTILPVPSSPGRQDLSFPLSCNLQARDVNDIDKVLDEIIVNVEDTNPPTVPPQPSTSEIPSTPPTPPMTSESTTSSFSRSSSTKPPSSHTSTSGSMSSSHPSSSDSAVSQLAQSTYSSEPSVSATPSSSALSDVPTTITPSTASKKAPLGAIIGGAIGGVILLIVVALFLFLFCRRRRQKRRVSILHDAQPDPSSLPPIAEKEEALIGLGGSAMLEIEKTIMDGQHSRTGSSSLGYPSDGHRSSDIIMEGRLEPVRYTVNVANNTETALAPVKVYDQEERSNRQQDLRSLSSDSSSESSLRRFSPLTAGYDEVPRQGSPEIENMDPETREKRREAILEQMRRVLDGEKNQES